MTGQFNKPKIQDSLCSQGVTKPSTQPLSGAFVTVSTACSPFLPWGQGGAGKPIPPYYSPKCSHFPPQWNHSRSTWGRILGGYNKLKLHNCKPPARKTRFYWREDAVCSQNPWKQRAAEQPWHSREDEKLQKMIIWQKHTSQENR